MPDSLVTPLVPADPDRVGPFTLLGRLGGGGMGTVYLARSAGGRVVALKAVHEHLAREPEFRIRFRLEAEAARTIGTLHGATVVDADTQTATPWLATEYVLGPSLAEAVERHGPLPEPAVRALGARLADALAGIHGAGLVHRDLKPSNILIDAAGPRIIDFGIARALGAHRLTRTGQAVGTPAYMSPEQASGHDHEPPGDVFALGGVLVFAATGHGPFPGGRAADVLYRVRYEDPDLSHVPAALVPVLERCLAKEPAERPRPVALSHEWRGPDGAFAALLPAPLLADIGRRAAAVWDLRPQRLPGPPPDTDPPAGPSRRRLLTAVGGGLLTVGAGGAVWAATRDPGPSGRPRAAVPSRAPGSAPEPLWRYRGEEETTLIAVREGVLIVSVGDVEDQRSVIGLDAATGKVRWKQPRALTFPEAGAGRVVVVPDAVGWGAQRLLLLDAATGKIRQCPGELARLTVGDGALLIATPDLVLLSLDSRDGRALLAYDATTGERRWKVRGTKDPAGRALLNGDTLFCVTASEGLALGVRDGGQHWRTELRTPSASLGKVHPRSLAADGLYIGGNRLTAVDTATGKVRWRFGEERAKANGGRAYYGIPAVQDGVVYVASLAAMTRGLSGFYDIVAVRASDGRELWTYHIGAGAKTEPPPLLHDGTLFHDTGEVPQPLLAVDLKKHRPPWTFRSGIPDDGHAAVDSLAGRTALVQADDRLYLSCGTQVLCLPAR